MLYQLAVLVGAYFLGAVPFGFIVARLQGIRDIRSHGSGNIGATNILRTMGPVPAVLVLVLDTAKGAFPVLAMGWAGGGRELQALAGLVAILGHMYPVTIGFRGGRGAATALGMVLAFDPVVGGVGLAIFILVVAATRYVSLGSMLGAASVVIAAALRGAPLLAIVFFAVCAALIIWRHRTNIQRLLAGTESKFGQRLAPQPAERRRA